MFEARHRHSTLDALERLATAADSYLDSRTYLDAFRLRCAIANARRYVPQPGTEVVDDGIPSIG